MSPFIKYSLMQVLDHILKHQIFGIAITELTVEVSRRLLYCSKDAAREYSICHMADDNGNIRFKECKHTWVTPSGNTVENETTAPESAKKQWRCAYCGASYENLRKGNVRIISNIHRQSSLQS